MIVADTHAWVWWAGAQHLLSKPARRALESETVGVSVISCWEVALLVRKGRLQLDRDVSIWIDQALALPAVRLLDLTPEIAIASTEMADWSNEDPADRIIVATALAHRARVVSKDRRIRRYKPATAIW